MSGETLKAAREETKDAKDRAFGLGKTIVTLSALLVPFINGQSNFLELQEERRAVEADVDSWETTFDRIEGYTLGNLADLANSALDVLRWGVDKIPQQD